MIAHTRALTEGRTYCGGTGGNGIKTLVDSDSDDDDDDDSDEDGTAVHSTPNFCTHSLSLPLMPSSMRCRLRVWFVRASDAV